VNNGKNSLAHPEWRKGLSLAAKIGALCLLSLVAIDIPYVWTIRPYGSFMGREADFLGVAMLSVPAILASGILLWIDRRLSGRWGQLTAICIALALFHVIQGATLARASYKSVVPNEISNPSPSTFTVPYKGSFFFDGAGMQGPYIRDMVEALGHAGIDNVHAINREDWSNGVVSDVINVLGERSRDTEDTNLTLKGAEGIQFNLIGYSFGALQASQAAIDYADRGHKVDHLVLIAAPISKEFLDALKGHPNIHEIITIEFGRYGDPIRAGMSKGELMLSLPKLALNFLRGKYGNIGGHFLLGGSPPVGSDYRRELAKNLYRSGLR